MVIVELLLLLWNNPQTVGFVSLGRSSSGVDPVVSFYTRPDRHFTGCTKTEIKIKQQTESGRKKQKNSGSELQNTGRWSWHVFVIYVCSWLITHNYQRCWLIWSSSSLLWTHFLEPTLCSVSWAWLFYYLLRSLIPKWLTFFVLSSGIAGFRGHGSVCDLCAKIDKGILKHSGTSLKTFRIISLATHNTETHTHIHIYIYIYIYIHTHEYPLSCHTPLFLTLFIYSQWITSQRKYKTQTSLLTCNVLPYPRGALIAPSTKAHAKEVAPHRHNKTNNDVLGLRVPLLLEINHREGFWPLPTVFQLAFHIFLYGSGALWSLQFAKCYIMT